MEGTDPGRGRRTPVNQISSGDTARCRDSRDGARRDLLLVEDDGVDAERLRRALGGRSMQRFRVHEETSLEDARRWLAEHEVDLVVLDLSLPDSDGLETYTAMREAAPTLPIVVVTGDDDVELARRLIHEGAQDYLVKGEIGEHHIARCFEYAFERMEARRELEEARSNALQASRAKSAFVSAMSHEIRTPMTAILGMADLLRDTPLKPDQRQYVEIFRRCGRSLLILINNVLELSKLESGSVELGREELDLPGLLEDSVETFAFAAHRKGLSIAADLDPGLPARVVGDEARLRQVLFNLLGNATKFTESGDVLLSARPERDQAGRERIRFEVSDTGSGISADRLEAIFERFVQAHEDVGRRHGGSGLGLSLSAELVRLMGGAIDVQSRPGEGSVFAFSLPLPATSSAAPSAVDLTGRRALVVDDGVERELMGRWLRNAGADVRECTTVEEAERALDAEDFDLAILDCRMPERGGLELAEARWPEGTGPDGPRLILLLPMDHRVEDPGRCTALRAASLMKPVRRTTLLDALTRAEDPRDESRPETDGGLEGARILLAEDSPDNRTLVLAFLDRAGCETEVAENGGRALDLWRRGAFDLVLMDMHMPEVDGAEATRRIRREEERTGRLRTPIVALTAYAFQEQAELCLAAGCDAHVAKPFDRGRLFAAIREALDTASIELDLPPEIADLASSYLANRRSELEELHAAAERGDFERIHRLGHNMKGTGTGYGFPEITRIGAALEGAADRAEAEEAARLVAELDRYLRLADAAVGSAGSPSDPGGAPGLTRTPADPR